MEYAFILTGQYPGPGGAGFRVFTFEGLFKTKPGMTRTAALADIMTAAKKHNDIPENVNVNVMFFSFEPNRLGGA